MFDHAQGRRERGGGVGGPGTPQPSTPPRDSQARVVNSSRLKTPVFRSSASQQISRCPFIDPDIQSSRDGFSSPEMILHKTLCETDSDTRPSDLGVGLSLVFLLAKTSDEFNKMVQVRAEMETLLKEIKDQVRKNSQGHDASKTCNLESTSSSCVTDRNESANVHLEDQVTLSSMEVVSHAKSSEDGCCMRMDVLEEEFHAELERLQVNYGSDIPSFLPEEEHDIEPSDEITDYRQELNDGMGEAVEDEDDDDAEYNGVSAVELERRLHELLHQRNQERIDELETALRCAEKKLVEKEMEVCLWKDTAKLALRQDSELQ